MQVTFTRSGTRRYSVTVAREAAPSLIMEPAPGYDDHLPHDLVHFIVERHWRLSEGIYGDLAAGGDAGTFRPFEPVQDRRARKRAGLATSGSDMDRSERLAAAVFAAWQVHRQAVAAGSTYAAETAAGAGVDAREISEVMPACDEAAGRWSRLGIGDSVTFEWSFRPERSGSRHASSRRR